MARARSTRKKARKKKHKRKLEVEWRIPPLRPESEHPAPRLPFTASTWYEFCTYRHAEYKHRGEHTAAMVYWTMRFWAEPDPHLDPTTDEGLRDVREYLDYKFETVPQSFG